MASKTFYAYLISYIVPTMVGEWVYHIADPFLAKLHYIEFWVTSYIRDGWPLKQYFLKNVRVGEQNLLRLINLIYSAHNGRGVCLPYCRPFLLKLHYIEFWVNSYYRGGWPLQQFFRKTFAM